MRRGLRRPDGREHVADVEDLSSRQADHEARGRCGRNPALCVALGGRDGTAEARERDDAGRTFERLEAAHHLRLLRGQPLWRKRLLGLPDAVVVDAVEPAGERRIARPALRAGVEVRVGRGQTAGDRAGPEVRELVVTKMTTGACFD